MADKVASFQWTLVETCAVSALDDSIEFIVQFISVIAEALRVTLYYLFRVCLVGYFF